MKMIEAPKITSADSPRAVIDAMNATRRADAMKTGRLDLSHTAVISKARTIADCRP